MNNKQKMIEELITVLDSIMEDMGRSPDDDGDQFQSWLGHVESAFKGAGLESELNTWIEARNNIGYSVEDVSLWAQMNSMRAILFGILDNLRNSETNEELFPIGIVEGTPNYIHQIAIQANGCFERGWYDACAVMMRKLIETLIIECFEKHGIESRIMKNNDDYVSLGDLITCFLNESWHLSRNTKNSLPKLREIKNLGDMSAHSRRYLATKNDISKYSQDFRIVIQELVYISGK